MPAISTADRSGGGARGMDFSSTPLGGVGRKRPTFTTAGSLTGGPMFPEFPEFPGFPGTGPVIGGPGSFPGTGPVVGPGGRGGRGGGPTVPGFPDLDIYANPSPQMAESIAAWRKRMAALEAKAGTPDPNLTWQTEEYKRRMSEDNTQRAMEKAASVIRSQAAGMGEAANVAGASTGRGEGMGAAGIGDTAQAALARSASDIALEREKQLDQLLLGGQAIMQAPGQREAGYEQLLSSTYNVNPFLDTARLGLGQQDLALRAYLGELDAEAKFAEAQARMYGSPLDWYRLLLDQASAY